MNEENGTERPKKGFWKQIKPYIIQSFLLTVVVLLVIYLLSGVRIIKPSQQAVVLRFGEKMPALLPPGTHYTLPYPIDQVFIYRPNEVKSVVVGVDRRVATFRPQQQNASYLGDGPGPEFLTGDENIIHLELNVQYQIEDPSTYLFRAAQVEQLIVVACERALTIEVARTHIDDILTSGREDLLARVKKGTQQTLTQVNSGVVVLSVNLAKAAPPTQVAQAFKDVASALEDKDRLINEANGLYNETIPGARGEAHRLLQEAEADRSGSIKKAQGEAARFMKTLDELRLSSNKDLAILQFYLEKMETLLPTLRKYVVDSDYFKSLPATTTVNVSAGTEEMAPNLP